MVEKGASAERLEKLCKAIGLRKRESFEIRLV